MFKEELKEVHSEFVALLDFLCEQEEIRIDTFNIGRQGFETGSCCLRRDTVPGCVATLQNTVQSRALS